MSTPRPVAPRIARLREDCAAATDPASLLAAFWAEADRLGTPLIEGSDRPGQHWVSFLWRVGADDDGLPEPHLPVMVMGGPALWWQLEDNVLEVLAGTDVAVRSYLVPADHRGRYILSPGDPLTPLPKAGTEESVLRSRGFRLDPRNRQPLVLTADPADPLAEDAEFSTFALPAATSRRWAGKRPSVPAGEVREHRLTSEHLGNTRRVWTYRPAPTDEPPSVSGEAVAAAGQSGEPPLLVVLDGRDWIDWMPLTTTVDNLIAEGLLPPISMVLPEALDTATRYRELTVLPAFTDFLVEELLPFAAEHLPVPVDPRRVAVHGKSFGGLGALAAGLERPEVFGTVLSQSGSFWWSGWDRDDPELLIERVRRSAGNGSAGDRSAGDSSAGPEPVPTLRVSLDIGELEGDAMLDSHLRMAQALADGRFPLRTHRFHGGHDINCWVSELPAALQWWVAPLLADPDQPAAAPSNTCLPRT